MKRCRLSQLGLNLASEEGQRSALVHEGLGEVLAPFLPPGQSDA